MNQPYIQEILRAADEQQIGIEVLDRTIIRPIKQTIIEIYTTNGSNLISNTLNDADVIYAPEGWHWIQSFLRDEPLILFFDGEDAQDGFLIQNPQDFDILMGDSFGMRFYLTNQALDYVVAVNDHDYLIVAGRAKPWLHDFLIQHQYAAIHACLEEEGISTVPIDPLSIPALKQQLAHRFGLPTTPMLSTTIRDSGAVVVRIIQPWCYLDEIIADEPVLLFFDHDGYGYHFHGRDDCQTVINALILPEFYVSNASLDYLVSVDRHKYLAGIGTAARWISRFKTTHHVDP